MTISVKQYRTAEPLSNENIAARLGLSLKDPFGNRYGFSGFYRGLEWVGGKANDTTFTITIRRGAEDLHTKAEKFASFVGEA
ncbi:MAG TPA: hypothetical protein VMU27_00875 [Candidatus Paceibacterota bacterium]|nr:hypothetical protein [Candidatus Paceibacterota bacterium]